MYFFFLFSRSTTLIFTSQSQILASFYFSTYTVIIVTSLIRIITSWYELFGDVNCCNGPKDEIN
jgi:hypothetical protein